MKKILLVTLLLAGCASIEPKEFPGPSGKPAYMMACSGMGRSLTACYQKAGELCPKGYNVVDRSSSTYGVPVSGGVMVSSRESLAVECK